MALENAAFVDGLVITNPTGSDSISQGDDHIRLIKKVLKATFPDADAAQTLFPPSGFSASLTAGTLATGSLTKMPFGTEVFDIKAEYDPSKLDWFIDNYADYNTKKIYILKMQINYSDGFDLMDQLRGGEWDAEESIKEYMYEVDYFSN